MNSVEIILIEKKESGVYKVQVNDKTVFTCNDNEDRAKAAAFDEYLKAIKCNNVYMAYHSI